MDIFAGVHNRETELMTKATDTSADMPDVLYCFHDGFAPIPQLGEPTPDDYLPWAKYTRAVVTKEEASEALPWIEDKIRFLKGCTSGDEAYKDRMAAQIPICETIRRLLEAASK